MNAAPALSRYQSLSPSFRFDAGSHASGRPAAAAPAPALEDIGAIPSARGYALLGSRFRATGGIARGDDLGRLLEYLDLGDFVSLARLLAEAQVFGFSWRETLWIPMFQFELRDLSVNQASRRVLAELSGTYAGWAQACWFAEPNPWLRGRTPLLELCSDVNAVLEAARADRFVVNG